MKNVQETRLDFTSECFERFQSVLKERCHEKSWIWILRDGIFGTITHDPLTFRRVIRTKEALMLLPGGWIVLLLIQKIQAVAARFQQQALPTEASHHLLFLSTRSNHIKRVIPLLRNFSERSSCTGWAKQECILPLIDDDLKSHMRLADDLWARMIQISDVLAAASSAKELEHIITAYKIPWLQRGKLRIYIAIFLAWRRFWEIEFRTRPEFVLTTYEKEPMAKAMLHVAHQFGVPSRIHWAHGLRHASLQATLASELWCSVEPDVEYYRHIIPSDCMPIYKQSPEALELIREIGIVDVVELTGLQTVHFLFLGNGFDSSYTDEMRVSDMRIIKIARIAMGSQIKWRFRPHPGAIQIFRDKLNELGLNDIDFSTNSLYEDLKWAHAVGASFSSVLLDAKSTGRKIFWIQEKIRPLYGVDELIRHGYGIHVNSKTVVSRIREAFGLIDNQD